MMEPQTRILLLRGVNVGGTGKLPMAEFRVLLADLGLSRVATFIQSGNAVFQDPGLTAPDQRISDAITSRYGFRPAVFLYDIDTYRAILAQNPFRAQGSLAGQLVHILFLASPALDADLPGLCALAQNGEEVALSDRALYLHAPNGIGTSLLAQKLPRFIKPVQTMRNQRSAEAILTLAESVAS